MVLEVDRKVFEKVVSALPWTGETLTEGFLLRGSEYFCRKGTKDEVGSVASSGWSDKVDINVVYVIPYTQQQII